MRCLFLVLVQLVFLSACGRISPQQATPKIVGGHDAEYQPYFVQLLEDATDTRGFCGGALIAPRLVVTAAHCVDSLSIKNLHVAMGFEKTGALHLTHPVKVVGISRHEKFSGSSLDGFDIALLFLEEYREGRFPKEVSSIAWSDDPRTPLASALTVVGLGNTTSLGQLFVDEVREVTLPVIPLRTCADSFSVDSSQICLGDLKKGGSDSCHGDSGSPAYARKSDGTKILVGLVSYGFGCAQTGKPGIYTNIASYANWITQQSEILRHTVHAAHIVRDLPGAVSTQCLGQIGNIVRDVDVRGVQRKTIWNITTAGITYSQTNVEPEGEVVASCSLLDENHKPIDVKWRRIKTSGIQFVATATFASGTKYISSPWRAKYAQDRITCDTNHGQVGLFDQRQETRILYDQRFHTLGESIPDPENEQSTWGCRLEDVSIEIFEPKHMPGKLAARIKHSSVGVISVLLVPEVQDPRSFLKAKWSDLGGRKPKLTIENVGKEDLYSWRLVCFENFSLKFASGLVIAADPEPTGSGFGVTVDVLTAAEGSVLKGERVSLTAAFPNADHDLNCQINGAFEVDEP